MQYGLIGEHLPHSFSPEIHALVGRAIERPYAYELCEIEPTKLASFLHERNFSAINVTIPYKQDVIAHLAEVSHEARAIGAVNTIVNKNGKLHGYNTDYFGLKALVEHAGITCKEKTVAILGTGGTAHTACAVVKSLHAKEIFCVTRSKKNATVQTETKSTSSQDKKQASITQETKTQLCTYEELLGKANNIDVIINTTPVGMFPALNTAPINLSEFAHLQGVIDAIYNPLNTQLVLSAQQKNIPASGGLYMLVAQAVYAAELFFNTALSASTINNIYAQILRAKQNIVLIGMPSCGKSSVGVCLAQSVKKEFFDSDVEIEKETGLHPARIIQEKGEDAFRNIEAKTIQKLAQKTSSIIACGGGVVLNAKNILALKQNGVVVFIDTPLEFLAPTDDRPLASTRTHMEKLFEERYPLYKQAADICVDGKGSIESVAARVEDALCKQIR